MDNDSDSDRTVVLIGPPTVYRIETPIVYFSTSVYKLEVRELKLQSKGGRSGR